MRTFRNGLPTPCGGSRWIWFATMGIAVTLVLLGTRWAVATEPQPPLTLNAAIQRVLVSSPAMRAADSGIDEAAAKLSQATLVYIPQAAVTASLTTHSGQRGSAFNGYVDEDERGPFFKFGVRGGFPIYAFGQLESLREAAGYGVEVAEFTREVVASELRLWVHEAWYGLLLANDLGTILDEGTSYLSKAKNRLIAMEESDDPTYDQVELLRLRVYEADVHAQRLAVARGKNQALAGLVALLNLPIGTAVDVDSPELKPVVVELEHADYYVELAKQHRPELKLANSAIAAANAIANLRLWQFFPGIAVVGEYNFATSPVADDQKGSFNSDPFHKNGGGAVLAMQWKVSLLKQWADRQEALAVLRGGIAKRDEFIQTMHSDVRQAVEEIDRQQQRLDSNAGSLKAARSWLVAKSDLYDTGFATFDEVSDALLQFYARKLAHVQTIHDLNLAISRLSRVVGTDVSTLAVR